jgi:hypothetical protein
MTAAAAVSFSSLGVGITVDADSRAHLARIESCLDGLLAGYVEPLDGRPVEHVFSIRTGHDGAVSLLLDGAHIGTGTSEDLALQYLSARIKLAIGASARTHVIVHAGVVAVGGGGVLLPAHSFQGKTTLVRELVRLGAAYYSDDLAIIDQHGLVHPFSKTLSLRGLTDDPYAQAEQSVECLGGVRGIDPLPVALVLFTGFAPDAVWTPRDVTPGHAVLKLVEHTLNVRTNPGTTMDVVGRVVGGASVLWESARGDAAEAAGHIVDRLRFIALATPVC